jgi:hypothetical protein
MNDRVVATEEMIVVVPDNVEVIHVITCASRFAITIHNYDDDVDVGVWLGNGEPYNGKEGFAPNQEYPIDSMTVTMNEALDYAIARLGKGE